MGNCLPHMVKCYFCHATPTDDIYIALIYHKSKYGDKMICSSCLEQKIIEKYLYKKGYTTIESLCFISKHKRNKKL